MVVCATCTQQHWQGPFHRRSRRLTVCKSVVLQLDAGAAIVLIAAGCHLFNTASKRVTGWSAADVEIRASPIHGRGVFATRHIPAGVVVGAYAGVSRTPAEVRDLCTQQTGFPEARTVATSFSVRRCLSRRHGHPTARALCFRQTTGGTSTPQTHQAACQPGQRPALPGPCQYTPPWRTLTSLALGAQAATYQWQMDLRTTSSCL